MSERIQSPPAAVSGVSSPDQRLAAACRVAEFIQVELTAPGFSRRMATSYESSRASRPVHKLRAIAIGKRQPFQLIDGSIQRGPLQRKVERSA